MKGLLIKDFELLKNQKRFFAIILLIAFIFLVSNTNNLFAVMYVTLFCSFFVLSSFSYDEFENGGAFLMTLPITRKIYVKEKYLFGLILSTASWALISVITNVFANQRGLIDDPSSWWGSVIAYLVIVWIALDFLIPIQIKFGAEKSRAAAIGIVGGVILIAVLIGKICNISDLDFADIVKKMENISESTLIILGIVVCAIASIISINVSNRMMENKEY